MKITLEIDSLDPKLVLFYESDQKFRIQDALYQGYQAVHSNQYALHLQETEQQHLDTIQALDQELERVKLESLEIQNGQKKKYEEEKTVLQQQISEIQTHQFHRERELEKQIRSQNQESLQKLEGQNQKLLEEKDHLHRQLWEIQQESSLKLENMFLQHKLETEELRNQLLERNSILSNSSKKGKEGENRMADILNDLFPQAEIYDTHQSTANGDFRIVYHGIQILYENKNFRTNVPKRDIEKFKRDVEESDCDCGIMCSENSGIACREDLDLEILGDAQKPAVYLHQTNSHLDKIRIAVLLLVNILENKLDLNTSTLNDIKNQVKDCDSILTLYQSNKKQIGQLEDNNEKLAIHSRRIKYKLEYIIQDLSNSLLPEGKGNKKIKQKCEYCKGSYVNLSSHYLKCEKKLELENGGNRL